MEGSCKGGMAMRLIDEKIKNISPSIYNEVLDFVDFLIKKNQGEIAVKKPTLKWAGALKEFKTKFSSVQLQKEALKWR
jgi:hypothetical protein